MRSSFFEFGAAISGLNTARSALNVTGHNIANANTDGYSRQYVEQRATKALYFGDGRGMVPTGSEVYGIGQIRSFYLDKKYWTENATLGEYNVKKTHTGMIETIFNEPSDTGFNAIMDKFFNSMQDLSQSTDDPTYRNNVLQVSQTLTKYFNSSAISLQQQQRSLNLELRTTVEQVNSIGRQIQTLNQQIYVGELDGSRANDLRDQRALLVDELSKLANIEVEEVEMNQDYADGKYYEPGDRGKSQKQFSVRINGYSFVDHFNMNELQCRERSVKNNPEDVEGLYDIYFTTTGVKFDITSSTLQGTLKGLADMRDGNNKMSFEGKVSEVETLGTGQVKLTLNNVNRDDMQYDGNIVIGGKSYAYTEFEYDPATKTASLVIPPLNGKASVANQSLSYSNLTIGGGGITFDVDAAEYAKYGLRVGNSTTIRIGDMYIQGKPITAVPDGEDPPRIITISVEGFTIEEPELEKKVSISNYTDYKGIPYYMRKLNEFVRTLAQAMNDGQYRKDGEDIQDVGGFANGIDLYGNKGADLFNVLTDIDSEGNEYKDYSKITAETFSIGSEILKDIFRMGCAVAEVSENPAVSDNNVILQLLSLKHNPTLFREGEIGNFLQAMIGELGVDASQAVDFEKNYTDIVNTVQNQRLSVSGVNLDEEAANMIKFQQAYNAAAKMITTIDQIYDTLINRMGV